MKIMITGAKGLLGSEFRELFQHAHEVIALTKEELDVTNPLQVSMAVKRIRPDAIIHCAAFSSMDAAVSERKEAFRVNALGTRNVAIAAQRIRAKFIYPSSAYVFDGRKGAPYTEEDRPQPLSIYGRTKQSGEKYASELCDKHYIVRTSWVYGRKGGHFVDTVLQFANEQRQIFVANDQVGSPTNASDIARFVLGIIETDKYGLYHASSTGQCTWYEFAKKIVELAGLNDAEVLPCSTKDLDWIEPFPKWASLRSVLKDNEALANLGDWKDALAIFLEKKKRLRDLLAYA
jgi:dTDP-4-dehydrorhamnose reductase